MIVITTPTGDIGRQVLAKVLDSGEPIRVVVRDPSRLPRHIRDRVEVIEGSHSRLEVAMKAFAGADAVFWLVPGDMSAASAEAAYVGFARPACEAFKARAVKRVVCVSALGRGWPGDAGHVTATLAMDDMIAATGVSYRALVCASLMENCLRQAALIRDKGMFFGTFPPDLKLPTCATRDIAAVAARLLLDASWHGVDSLPMLGPEDLSFAKMTAIMSDVLGKAVHYRTMAMEELRATLAANGASEGMAQAMIDMMTAKNQGMDNGIARMPASFADTPTTFRQWCEAVLKPAVFA